MRCTQRHAASLRLDVRQHNGRCKTPGTGRVVGGPSLPLNGVPMPLSEQTDDIARLIDDQQFPESDKTQ